MLIQRDKSCILTGNASTHRIVDEVAKMCRWRTNRDAETGEHNKARPDFEGTRMSEVGETKNSKPKNNLCGNGSRIGVCVAIGVAIGAAYGASSGNMAQSAALGVALGAAFGAIFEFNQRRRSNVSHSRT